MAIAMSLEPGLEALQLERFTSEDDEAQRELVFTSFIRFHELTKSRRCLIEHRDLLAAQQLVESFRRSTYEMRHDDESSAIEQRAPQLPDRKVESERVKKRPHIVFIEVEPLASRVEETHDIGVCDHHAFRCSG